MDWITAALTLISMELIARRKWYGWLVGLINQVFWMVLIIDREMWGLGLLAVILTWRYSVALLKWKRDA